MIDTKLLSFLAIVLITNSHLDLLYPDARMGTGGALGNSIFFLLSGYGLTLSSISRKYTKSSFFEYFNRRITRIYPSLILVASLVVVLSGSWRVYSWVDWFTTFIWPKNYWFLCAIILFYFPFYWVVEWSSKYLLVAIFLLAIPYFYIYFFYLDLTSFKIEDGYFKWIVYSQIMLFGALIARESWIKLKASMAGIGALASVFIFYFLKIKLFKYDLGYLQFLVQVMLFPFAFFTFQLLTNLRVLGYASRYKIDKVAAFIGGITLEIYLVQVPLIPVIVKQAWRFPIGWLTAIILIIGIAFILAKLTNYLLKMAVDLQKTAT